MNLYYITVLIGVLSLNSINADNVPVLSYFGSNSALTVSHSIGHSIKPTEFINEIKRTIRPSTPVDLIYLDELNSEDVVYSYDNYELKPDIEFQPLVTDPYDNLIKYFEENHIKYNLINKANIYDALSLFQEKQAQSNKVNVILTGKKAKNVEVKSRIKRDAEQKAATVKDGQIYYFTGENCSASFSSIFVINQTVALNSDELYLNLSTANYEFTCGNTSARLFIDFTDDNSAGVDNLELNFELSSRYWTYTTSNITTKQESFNLVYMGAPYAIETPNGYSFACTKAYFKYFSLKTLSVIKIALYINNIQIQPFGVQVFNATDFNFGRINYCQGFFTSGIWMAITSSLVLAFILSCGVSFLLKINTMDRFDDPKGKQLTIAAEK